MGPRSVAVLAAAEGWAATPPRIFRLPAAAGSEALPREAAVAPRTGMQAHSPEAQPAAAATFRSRRFLREVLRAAAAAAAGGSGGAGGGGVGDASNNGPAGGAGGFGGGGGGGDGGPTRGGAGGF